jgi:hypothetical protein
MPLRFAIVGAGIIGLATASEANGEVMGGHPTTARHSPHRIRSGATRDIDGPKRWATVLEGTLERVLTLPIPRVTLC